jgi:hypothetical protein
MFAGVTPVACDNTSQFPPDVVDAAAVKLTAELDEGAVTAKAAGDGLEPPGAAENASDAGLVTNIGVAATVSETGMVNVLPEPAALL